MAHNVDKIIALQLSIVRWDPENFLNDNQVPYQIWISIIQWPRHKL